MLPTDVSPMGAARGIPVMRTPVRTPDRRRGGQGGQGGRRTTFDRNTPGTRLPGTPMRMGTPIEEEDPREVEIENLRQENARLRMERDDIAAERYPRRSTIFTEGGTELRTSKPKLDKPTTFNAEYTTDYSVLNWIVTVRKYFETFSITEDDYSKYAYTYMGTTVQSWYNVRFGGRNPTWETLCKALKDRFLPDDHEIMVKNLYENVLQKGSIVRYIERFQEVLVVLQNTGIMKSDKELVIHFISGLKYEEDRRVMLNQALATMEDAYRAANKLRTAKNLSRYTRSGGENLTKPQRFKGVKAGSREDAILNILTGQAKTDALKKGLCLNCGKAGHWMAVCKEPRLNSFDTSRYPGRKKGSTAATKGSSSKTYGKKKTRFHKLEGESENEYEEEDENDPSEKEEGTDSEEESGNEVPESEAEEDS